MIPEQCKQIEDKLRKREFAELSKKPGVWVRGTTPNMRIVDLTKLSTEFPGLPIVCISTGIERIEQGHGIAEIDDIRDEIAGILKHKGADEQKEHPAPEPDTERAKVSKNEPETKAQPKPEPEKHTMTGKEYDEKLKEKEMKKMESKPEEKALAIKESETALTIEVIRQYICQTATEIEAYNFLQLCLRRDLNPFLKEAYLIKYGNQPATMVVGKDAFTRKAEESGKLDGYEAGIIVLNKDKQVERKVGVVQLEGDVLVGGWAKVFRKDMKYPFVCEVPLTEYMKFKEGKPMSSWATMPGTMIRKVALVQALREGFTKELGGCYDAAELLDKELK